MGKGHRYKCNRASAVTFIDRQTDSRVICGVPEPFVSSYQTLPKSPYSLRQCQRCDGCLVPTDHIFQHIPKYFIIRQPPRLSIVRSGISEKRLFPRYMYLLLKNTRLHDFVCTRQ